jgi:ferredoxin
MNSSHGRVFEEDVLQRFRRLFHYRSIKGAADVFDIVDKYWPMSVGDGKATRKKKPRILAITTDCCTGCAGSPACIEYCPIEACMFWVPDEDHPPFGRIEVDPYLCIGCQKCTSKGPDGAFLDGCPWDAIEMIPTDDWEAMHDISLPDAPPPPPVNAPSLSSEPA